MNFVLWIIGAVVLGAVAGGIAVLWWLRYTLLNGVVVDTQHVDPALQAEIERLELEYAVAEELGYQGDALLGIESKLNAARLRAAGVTDPEVTLAWVVTAPVLQAMVPAETVHICPLPQFMCSFISGVPGLGHGAISIGYVGASLPAVAVE